ncbi:MAG: 23S rRNA (uracil(1939)-C(5))-methyltransferase RlmD [Myxococcota bacterium]|nr:23S rRNA (uracil(1939)-C(5))-methyltransferase RlmD [Myxococcota bacterium]
MTKIRVTIEARNHDGRGWAQHAGKNVLVPNAVVGEDVWVEIDRESAKTVQGRCVDFIIDKSEETSTCRHLMGCTGCTFLRNDYTSEALFKKRRFQDLLDGLGESDVPLDFIGPTSPYNYRHYVKLVAERDGNRTLFGSFRRGTHEVTDNVHCKVLIPELRSLVFSVTESLKNNEMPIFPDEGGLRYLTIRWGRKSKSALLSLVVVPGGLYSQKAWGKWALEECEKMESLSGVVCFENDLRTNKILTGEPSALAGKPWVEEYIDDYHYRLGANSFFQINPPMAESMFGYVCDGLSAAKKGVELFSGVGALTYPLLSKIQRLWTVELGEEEVAFAHKNEERLGISGVTAIAGDARKIGPALIRDESPDVLVVDPPRCGMGSELLQSIQGNSSIQEIALLACQPEALKRDFPVLVHAGFRVEKIACVDQFPRTEHYEAVVILKR